MALFLPMKNCWIPINYIAAGIVFIHNELTFKILCNRLSAHCNITYSSMFYTFTRCSIPNVCHSINAICNIANTFKILWQIFMDFN